MNKFFKQLLSDLKFALAHPAVIRKELLAVATSVSGDIALFTSVVHVSGPVATGLTVAQAVGTFIFTFLGKNESPAAIKAAAKK